MSLKVFLFLSLRTGTLDKKSIEETTLFAACTGRTGRALLTRGGTVKLGLANRGFLGRRVRRVASFRGRFGSCLSDFNSVLDVTTRTCNVCFRISRTFGGVHRLGRADSTYPTGLVTITISRQGGGVCASVMRGNVRVTNSVRRLLPLGRSGGRGTGVAARREVRDVDSIEEDLETLGCGVEGVGELMSCAALVSS